ncbi:helix-turn-helix domain-containing protein [Lactobacillus bombicola]|uniref:helix-turn-helix domain-containing protein n=1 Tax=Lactobacillus bombicola TaxID=1505723 RepID=UPI000E56BDB5|nr:helix-turn-helix domain-containing protein [Lactobacillus bombicola]RHW48885.1 hypothetical protein DS833_06810 [Lactobacillus bombicola]
MDSSLFMLLKLFVENGSITKQEIAVYNNISFRTVDKRISELNRILGEAAHISSGIERFSLTINNYPKFLDLETQFLKGELNLNDPIKREAFIIDILIKSNDYIPIDEIADRINISRKTVNNDLRKIKINLKKYKGRIISKTGKGIKISFQTSFEKICALRNFVIEHTSNSVWLAFTSEISSHLKKLNLSKQAYHQVLNNVLTLKVFKDYGHVLDCVPRCYHSLWAQNAVITDLIDYLQEKLKYLTESEISFILSPLDLYKNEYLDFQKLKLVFKKNYKLFFIPLKDKLRKYGLDTKNVYERLKWHVLFSVNRTLLYTKIGEVLPRTISDNYPISLELSLALANKINSEYKVSISKDEINYYVIYFEMFLEEVSAISQDTKNQVKIAFIGSIRSSVKEFIEKKLSNIFENLKIISFSNVAAFKQQHDKFLLVFVDKPLEIEHIQVINVGTVFRPEALSVVMQISIIEQLIKQNKIAFSVKHFEAESYYVAVDRMIDHQIKSNQVSEDFKQNWKSREKVTNNIFSNGIAIPHAIDHLGKERILVSVGIIDNKILFKKKELKLIFLIGIPENLNNELIDATSRLYDFIGLISRNEILYNNFVNYDSSKQLIQIVEGV